MSPVTFPLIDGAGPQACAICGNPPHMTGIWQVLHETVEVAGQWHGVGLKDRVVQPDGRVRIPRDICPPCVKAYPDPLEELRRRRARGPVTEPGTAPRTPPLGGGVSG